MQAWQRRHRVRLRLAPPPAPLPSVLLPDIPEKVSYTHTHTGVSRLRLPPPPTPPAAAITALLADWLLQLVLQRHGPTMRTVCPQQDVPVVGGRVLVDRVPPPLPRYQLALANG